MTVHHTIEITPERLREFVELAEEPKFHRIIDQALALLYLCFRNVAKGYRLALIPHDEYGQPDNTRKVIYVNTAQLL